MDALQKKSQQILIVDDKPKNLQIIGTNLREKGFLFSIARSGSQALEIIEHNPPDLILLDIVMDEMDGFETCRRLKNNPATRDIPVIFLSALSDTTDKVEGFKVGAVDFVTKPFQAEEVLARVETHLTLQTSKKYLEAKNSQLQNALDDITALQGILPICAKCKKICNDNGHWQQIESYITQHSEVEFSHSMCPECIEVMYGDQEWYRNSKAEKK